MQALLLLAALFGTTCFAATATDFAMFRDKGRVFSSVSYAVVATALGLVAFMPYVMISVAEEKNGSGPLPAWLGLIGITGTCVVVMAAMTRHLVFPQNGRMTCGRAWVVGSASGATLAGVVSAFTFLSRG